MNARRLVGTVAVVGLALPFAVLLQLAVASDLSLVAGAPDLVLVVLCALALARGPELACAAGFTAGLSLDVLAEHALGRDALIYCVAGYGLGVAGERLRPPAPVRSLLLVALGTALVRIGEGAIAFLVGSDDALGRTFTIQLLAAPAAGVLFAIPLLALLRWVLGFKAPPRRSFPVPDPLPEADVAAIA